MKVNQGNVVINSSITDVKELLTTIFGYFNTNRLYTERQVAEILNEQGKLRISTSNVGVLPNSDVGSRKWETVFTTNLESDYLLRNVLKTVSLQFDLNPKKSIIIFLISQGFHRTLNDFHLDEEFGEVSGWKYEDLKVKSEENKEINAIIESVKNNTENLASAELESLYTWLTETLGEDYSNWFKAEIGEDIVIRDSSTLKRFVYRDSMPDDVYNELSTRIDEIRAKSVDYLRPAVSMLCRDYFHIGDSTYRRCKNVAIKSLVNTFGTELMKYTIERD